MSLSRSALTFGPFRLEPDPLRLWRGAMPVALQPRPLAVLGYLAARPGVVVGARELLAAVWGDVCVTRAVLKVAVRTLRAALGDDAAAPRYIETVGREGYRFIGARGLTTALRDTGDVALPALVGRVGELGRLRTALRQAAAGRRVVLLVSGEAGGGKTALIEQALAEAATDPAVYIARGYCPESDDSREAALPIVEAMTRLVRAQPAFGAMLRRCAPSWAAMLPALGRAGMRVRRPDGAAPARHALREIVDALEAFSAQRTVVLICEDLQWSDRATRAVLFALARARHPARLLVIASARPGGRIAGPEADALLARGLVEELPLRRLTPRDVATYVALRFAGAPAVIRQHLADRIHAASDGNALFMVTMTNDLVARGLLVWRTGPWTADPAESRDDLPLGDATRALVARCLAALTAADRRLLEAASVIEDEFGADDVAAVLGEPVDPVEARCDHLASRATVIAEQDAPVRGDGAAHGRYRFRHRLYRLTLRDGMGRARRLRFQQAIAARVAARRAAESAPPAVTVFAPVSTPMLRGAPSPPAPLRGGRRSIGAC